MQRRCVKYNIENDNLSLRVAATIHGVAALPQVTAVRTRFDRHPFARPVRGTISVSFNGLTYNSPLPHSKTIIVKKIHIFLLKPFFLLKFNIAIYKSETVFA